MNRFDTVKLSNGSIAMLLGIEKIRGKETGAALVSTFNDNERFVCNVEDLTLIKRNVMFNNADRNDEMY